MVIFSVQNSYLTNYFLPDFFSKKFKNDLSDILINIGDFHIYFLSTKHVIFIVMTFDHNQEKRASGERLNPIQYFLSVTNFFIFIIMLPFNQMLVRKSLLNKKYRFNVCIKKTKNIISEFLNREF